MSKLMDAAEEWADMLYPDIPTGPHSAQRTKIRTAYMLGFERGYKIAARARLPAIEYMTKENDDDARTTDT
jgi:hypothetical protein